MITFILVALCLYLFVSIVAGLVLIVSDGSLDDARPSPAERVTFFLLLPVGCLAALAEGVSVREVFAECWSLVVFGKWPDAE